MLTYRSYRTELDPTAAQRILFAKHCGAARFAYNWGLARRNAEYLQNGRVLTSVDLHRELNRLKRSELPWMYEVSKCAPHEALRDLDNAFRQFLRGRRVGKRIGFPRFKTKHSTARTFRLNGVIRVGEAWIQLPRLGRLRLKERSYLPGDSTHVLSATVSGLAGRWYVALRILEERPDVLSVGGQVGIDLGLVNLVTTSEGVVYPNPRPRKCRERKVRRLSRQLARRKSGSRNRAKTRLRLARLHVRIANTRNDYLHKVTTELAKTKSVVVIEDLSVRALQRSHRLGGSLADAALGDFKTKLRYKAEWYGTKLVIAGRFFPSSQQCSACGYLHRALALADRMFRCPACEAELDRDLNAARNLLSVAASAAETLNACGAGSADRDSSVQLPVMKQEPEVAPEPGKVIGVS